MLKRIRKTADTEKKTMDADHSNTEQGLTETDYKKGRNLFVLESCVTTGISTMSTGVVISGILKYLGASDAINGIISGIPVSAGMLLIFVPVLFRKLARTKRTVIFFAVLHRLLFALMLLVPLIVEGTAARLFVFVALYLIANILAVCIGPSAANWLISLVPSAIRGRYFGFREGVTVATIAVVSVAVGLMIDHMKAIGNEVLGYAVCTVIIVILTVLDFLCLFHIKEPLQKINPIKQKIKTMLMQPLKDKAFRKVFLLSVLWNFGAQLGGPYYAIYAYSVLELNYTYIMVMSVVMYVFRVFSAQYWGRLADKKNWVHITKLSLVVLSVGYGGNILLNENTHLWIYPILQVFTGIGGSGVTISLFNLQFEYAPQESRTAYISMNGAIGSFVGFLAILLGSAIVGGVGGLITYIGSFPIHGMQYLLFASGVVIFISSFYVHKFIK